MKTTISPYVVVGYPSRDEKKEPATSTKRDRRHLRCKSDSFLPSNLDQNFMMLTHVLIAPILVGLALCQSAADVLSTTTRIMIVDGFIFLDLFTSLTLKTARCARKRVVFATLAVLLLQAAVTPAVAQVDGTCRFKFSESAGFVDVLQGLCDTMEEVSRTVLRPGGAIIDGTLGFARQKFKQASKCVKQTTKDDPLGCVTALGQFTIDLENSETKAKLILDSLAPNGHQRVCDVGIFINDRVGTPIEPQDLAACNRFPSSTTPSDRSLQSNTCEPPDFRPLVSATEYSAMLTEFIVGFFGTGNSRKLRKSDQKSDEKELKRLVEKATKAINEFADAYLEYEAIVQEIILALDEFEQFVIDGGDIFEQGKGKAKAKKSKNPKRNRRLQLTPNEELAQCLSQPTETSQPSPTPTIPATSSPTILTTIRPVVNPGGRQTGNFGDPHLSTFDRLRFDCQAEGEFITVTSAESPEFMVQERFTSIQSTFCSQASVSTGVVVQDLTLPRVQVSTPTLANASSLNSIRGCPIDLYVNGVASLLTNDFGLDVDISSSSSSVRIFYPSTFIRVDIGVRNSRSFGCSFLIQVFVPNNYRPGELIYGLLGTPNGDRRDDWRAPNGTVITTPAVEDATIFSRSYNYCATNWCIRDSNNSIFTYNTTLGESFDAFSGCDENYSSEIEDALTAGVDSALTDICGTDVFCLVDGLCGDLDDAINALADEALVVSAQEAVDPLPSSQPSLSLTPSVNPSLEPSAVPSGEPTTPSSLPSEMPSGDPSTIPSSEPTLPSALPSLPPSSIPSTQAPSPQPFSLPDPSASSSKKGKKKKKKTKQDKRV